MCALHGYDCHCSVPNASTPHMRLLQRGRLRSAWKNGDDAAAAFRRLRSHVTYAPSTLRHPPASDQGTGSWIVQYDNFTTPLEAKALIDMAHASGWARGSGGSTRAQRATRTNAVAWCQGSCLANPLVERVLRKMEQVTGVSRAYYEPMQLLRYNEGEFFRRHHDSYDGAFGAQRMGHRIMTAFMYLSDVEGGGETAFTDLPGNPSAKPQLGRMIVWPNVWTAEPTSHDHRMMHEARPVTQGVKYGANVWIRMYPNDNSAPVPPLCDLYPHVPECARDTLAARRRERGRRWRGGRIHGNRPPPPRTSLRLHTLDANGTAPDPNASYTCFRNRDFRAPCIRPAGVGCPFREVHEFGQCRALCDEYEGVCFTFTHNIYGECYLRGGYSGAGVPDVRRHRTISCRKNAEW